MAGTPTPNYQFPTYAETDTPNLAGAYNQAVNAIDAKIKEVADSVSSGGDVPDATSTTKGIAKLYDSTTIGDSTQNDGGVTPAAMKAAVDGVSASISGKQDKLVATAPIDITGTNIGVADSIPGEDGTATNSGVVTVTGKQEDIANATSLSTSPVPNAKAVKDYVDAKVPAEQLAYTGTTPIVVDNDSHSISVRVAGDYTWDDNEVASVGSVGVVCRVNLPGSNTAQRIDGQANTYWGKGAPSYAVPTIATLKTYVAQHTPNATTSTKGLVQLSTGNSVTSSTTVLTEAAMVNELKTIRNNMATQAVDVQTLAGKLFVDTQTGLVFYKPSV